MSKCSCMEKKLGNLRSTFSIHCTHIKKNCRIFGFKCPLHNSKGCEWQPKICPIKHGDHRQLNSQFSFQRTSECLSVLLGLLRRVQSILKQFLLQRTACSQVWSNTHWRPHFLIFLQVDVECVGLMNDDREFKIGHYSTLGRNDRNTKHS